MIFRVKFGILDCTWGLRNMMTNDFLVPEMLDVSPLRRGTTGFGPTGGSILNPPSQQWCSIMFIRVGWKTGTSHIGKDNGGRRGFWLLPSFVRFCHPLCCSNPQLRPLSQSKSSSLLLKILLFFWNSLVKSTSRVILAYWFQGEHECDPRWPINHQFINWWWMVTTGFGVHIY